MKESIYCTSNVCNGRLTSLTMRFTPQLGRKSVAADTKSFPYFFSKLSRIANSSGISEHLGAANIKLDIPSFRSAGQSLEEYGVYISN